MTRTLMMITAASALALAACGKSDDASVANANMDMNADLAANDMAMNADANMATGTAMAAQDFVTNVAASDMYEIESGKLAETMATNADLKSFGKMLQTDHKKSSDMLKSAAAKASATPPTSLPADKQAKLDALKAAKGAEFDKLFVDQQMEGHQMALDMLKSYASGGDQESLKQFATTAQPVVQAHLDKLSGMKK